MPRDFQLVRLRILRRRRLRNSKRITIMAQLKLTANTPSEQRILEYLQNNASETLAEKINNGTPFEKDGKPLTNKKSLSGFMKYACGEARNLAANGETAAC